MWFAAIVLVVVCTGMGFVIHLVYKYKRLIRKGLVVRSSRTERSQPRTASPDRRGMGAQSDFIAESFVPSLAHRDQKVNMARTLIAVGLDPELAAARVGVSVDLLNEKVHVSGSTQVKVLGSRLLGSNALRSRWHSNVRSVLVLPAKDETDD